MYSIIAENGREIGVVEHPTYIYLQSNVVFGLCPESFAEGIAYNGKPYQLADRHSMEKELPVVQLIEIDTGNRITEQQATSARNTANIDYISMMADIDLPTEEGLKNESEV